MEIQSKYDIVIIGGGAYGLSIAYYLSKNQDLKIALLQQYSIGHTKGSSHSTTRITRSLYEKQVYRDLNMECLNKNWPQLQKVLKQKLVYNNQFIYFDDNEDSYKSYRKVAQQNKPENVKICQDHNEYKQYFKGRKYPQINSKYPPIIDKKAGVIYASIYIKSLKQYLQNKCDNVVIMEHTLVRSINQNQKEISIQTPTQILRTNKVVLACGKWIKQLAPQTFDLFHVVKQFPGFLQLEPQKQFQIGHFPSFAHNDKNKRFFYSAPGDTTQRLGLKLAEHRFSQPINPDAVQNTIDYQFEQVRKKALQYFGDDLVRVKKVQECIYTNTKSNDFIIDWAGQSERVLICSCCSGHGFKFSPIIGQIVAQIISANEEQKGTGKQIKNETFKKHQHMFKIAYHRGINLE